MKTLYNKVKNKNEGASSMSRFKIPILISTGLILYFLIMGFSKPIDQATIQMSKIEFSQELCDHEVAAIINLVKETQGIKSAVFFPQTNALVTSFDNRLLSVSAVEKKINMTYPGQVKIISNKDFSNARGCPLHKSKFLSYIFNFF